VTSLAAVLLLASVWLAVWSYLLYPPWIRLLAGRRPDRRPLEGELPSVEVLVAAADEEAVIGMRVRNLLSQTLAAPLSVAVGCDGCADRTAAAAREAGGGDPRLRVVEFAERRGKAAVVNDLVATSAAGVLVFTDANTRFEPGAVDRLARALAREGVGAACGRLVIEAEAGGQTPETLFWERENLLKEAEGRLGVCLGANGAIYAARRASVEPLPPDTTAFDDFLVPARIAGRGEQVIYAGDAVARETAPADARDELRRRFRIGVGAGQILRRERWLWNPRRGLLAFAFLSRKAARWLSPAFALLALLAALASEALRPWAAIATALAAIGLLAMPRRLRSGAFGRLYYFAVINLALGGGVLAGLAGHRRPAWKPPARQP
jgi:cellulose synthase/poly-beta-1,6-N-acetylglucosamine synthase-like glycosyltransferase